MPKGAILVIDSRKMPGRPQAGSILVTRLMVRGVSIGNCNDGGFPDRQKLLNWISRPNSQ